MSIFKQTEFRLMAALVGGILILWPMTALALVECPINDVKSYCQSLNDQEASKDCDSDGFTNFQECNGFDTVGGRYIFGYLEAITGNDDIQVNPAEPNLMFLTVKFDSSGAPYDVDSGLMYDAIQSNKNGNALSFYTDGLFVHAHRIDLADVIDGVVVADPGTPQATTPVRAALIIEDPTNPDLYYNGEYLGMTEKGSVALSDPDAGSMIFTQVIKDYIDEQCNKYGGCRIINSARSKTAVAESLDSSNHKPVINYYILQVIAHEMGHNSKLAPTDPVSYYHYSKSETVMDPSATFKRGTFIIPIQFQSPTDKEALTLWSETAAN